MLLCYCYHYYYYYYYYGKGREGKRVTHLNHKPIINENDKKWPNKNDNIKKKLINPIIIME